MSRSAPPDNAVKPTPGNARWRFAVASVAGAVFRRRQGAPMRLRSLSLPEIEALLSGVVDQWILKVADA